MRPQRDLDGATAAHRALLPTLASLDDAEARRPSRLPGWTVGHVLTHLARNADSMVRALEAAAAGRAGERYPGGAEQREAEIEAGAGRPAAALVADVAGTIADLEAAWSAVPDAGWSVTATTMGRPEPVAGLAFKRWREVEVHHADLGLGFGFADWSPAYVRLELHHAALAWRASMPMGQTELPAAALALEPAARLAWLMGRLDVTGLPPVAPWW